MINNSLPEPLQELIRKHFSKDPESISDLREHASPRKRFRIVIDGKSYIAVVYDNDAENKAFLSFAKSFMKIGLPVPEVFCSNLDQGVYVEQDLGQSTLFDLLVEARTNRDPFPDNVEDIYKKALEHLVTFQVQGGQVIDFSVCTNKEDYDQSSMLSDLYYFRDEFLKRTISSFDETRLEQDFSTLVNFLARGAATYFMYRDFQARNIMVSGEKLHFIDFQSGSRGPLQCDVISLIFQSQARIPEEARTRLLNWYIQCLCKEVAIDRSDFLSRYDGFIFLRLMQVLGAYGKLGLGQRKPYFLEGIPIAITNLLSNLGSRGLPVEASYLQQVLYSLESYDSEEGRCL